MTRLSAVLPFRAVAQLASLTLVLLLGCGDTPPPEETTTGPSFAFAQGSEPRSLDPGFITDTGAGFLVSNLFEGLVVWDPSGTEVRPGIAERWESSADGLVWTFHLRPDAIWSNGDPVTATDFVLSWRRVLDPARASDYAALLEPVKGAMALHEGVVVDPTLLGVEARDRSTLVVTLQHPTPWFAAIAAHYVLAPVNTRSLKRHGYAWTRPENIVVNGPFTLESQTPGEELVLVRNPYYHSADEVKLERVVAKIETDPARVLQMYETGEIQWTGHATGLLPLDRVRELSARPDAHSASKLATAWYVLNTQDGPLADARVRRALSLALDREALSGLIEPGGAVAAGLVPPGIPDYVPVSALKHDPEEARRLLAEAGFPGGEGFPVLELAVDSRAVHERIAAQVVEGWKASLGIEVTVFTRDWPVHVETVQAGDFEVGRGGWLGDYPDPATFLDIFHSENALNTAGWSNETYDSLCEEAHRTEDAASRMRLLGQLERILMDESPVLPLFHFGEVTLLKPEVRGYIDNALGEHALRYMSIDGP
jgi:oligopeptide transport system substrate-binding protein